MKANVGTGVDADTGTDLGTHAGTDAESGVKADAGTDTVTRTKADAGVDRRPMQSQREHAAAARPVETLSRPALCNRYQHADQVLGKRWVGLIVHALLDGPCRFSEIAARIGMLSDRMLSTRLGELEARGIVERRVDAEAKPVRIEYALTEKGAALEPVVREITRWADLWIRDDEPALEIIS